LLPICFGCLIIPYSTHQVVIGVIFHRIHNIPIGSGIMLVL